MTLYEQKAAKIAELKELQPKIEAGDTDAAKAGEEIVAAIEQINASIEAAQKANDILSQIGTDETTTEEDPKMAEPTLKSMNLEPLKSSRGSVSVQLKANADTVTGAQVVTTDNRVVDIKPSSDVRNLFGTESISGNALTYFVMGATEGASGVVAEGATKKQIHPTYTSVTAALTKIAAFLKETDELLNDTPYLESAVRGRGVYAHDKAVESYLVSTLTGTSGIQTLAEAISFDSLLKAKTSVKTATGYDADAVLINPEDLQTLLLTKDANKQYLLGGPAYAGYGTGQYAGGLPIWGMSVVACDSVTKGTAIVGAFKAGASIVSKAGEGFRVEVSNADEDDFQKNMVTVRIEERLLEAVRVPSAFVKVAAA